MNVDRLLSLPYDSECSSPYGLNPWFSKAFINSIDWNPRSCKEDWIGILTRSSDPAFDHNHNNFAFVGFPVSKLGQQKRTRNRRHLVTKNATVYGVKQGSHAIQVISRHPWIVEPFMDDDDTCVILRVYGEVLETTSVLSKITGIAGFLLNSKTLRSRLLTDEPWPFRDRVLNKYATLAIYEARYSNYFIRQTVQECIGSFESKYREVSDSCSYEEFVAGEMLGRKRMQPKLLKYYSNLIPTSSQCRLIFHNGRIRPFDEEKSEEIFPAMQTVSNGALVSVDEICNPLNIISSFLEFESTDNADRKPDMIIVPRLQFPMAEAYFKSLDISFASIFNAHSYRQKLREGFARDLYLVSKPLFLKCPDVPSPTLVSEHYPSCQFHRDSRVLTHREWRNVFLVNVDENSRSRKIIPHFHAESSWFIGRLNERHPEDSICPLHLGHLLHCADRLLFDEYHTNLLRRQWLPSFVIFAKRNTTELRTSFWNSINVIIHENPLSYAHEDSLKWSPLLCQCGDPFRQHGYQSTLFCECGNSVRNGYLPTGKVANIPTVYGAEELKLMLASECKTNQYLNRVIERLQATEKTKNAEVEEKVDDKCTTQKPENAKDGEEEYSLQCCVCLDEVCDKSVLGVLYCGHILCWNCIHPTLSPDTRNSSQRNCCPVCRRRVASHSRIEGEMCLEIGVVRYCSPNHLGRDVVLSRSTMTKFDHIAYLLSTTLKDSRVLLVADSTQMFKDIRVSPFLLVSDVSRFLFYQGQTSDLCYKWWSFSGNGYKILCVPFGRKGTELLRFPSVDAVLFVHGARLSNRDECAPFIRAWQTLMTKRENQEKLQIHWFISDFEQSIGYEICIPSTFVSF